jgi:cell division protease FtsH
MELRRFFRVPLLLIAAAVLLLLFALNRVNSGPSYQQVGPSKIVSLIDQGQVKSALITDKNQTIQITTKNGKQLEASWNSGQGLQLRNALQTQLDQGNLPGGYNVTVPQSHALLDVLLTAFTFAVIVALLLFWRIDYPTEFKRWLALADQAGQMAKRWVQQT